MDTTTYGYHTSIVGVDGEGQSINKGTTELIGLEEAKAELIKAIVNADEGTSLSLNLRASQWH